MAENSVLASNIPTDVPRSKIEEFFSFCGKIERIENYDLSRREGEQVVHVFFASPSAQSTALLLNGAELAGKPVVVLKFNNGQIPQVDDNTHVSPGEYAKKQEAVKPLAGIPKEAKSNESSSGSGDDDIDQEHKPKSAIFAEYLANGYVLSDNLTKKAIEYDKQNGYSDKFKKFLADIDDKYKIQDKQKEVDQKYNISSKLQKYFDSSQKYAEQAKQTGIGSRLHKFYQNVVNDASEIHEEAKRLAELKKNSAGTPAVSAGVDAAADSAPLKQ
ncbi:CYFA0S20e00804g1_1 [Cyberlindnera fabianii]|uniref:CYFA0S20e00804g1_1 n=1 Tax=Cyberlindnera fabianii TaxID=36022 RepID=A0A061BFU2_CYBFA|nr:Protein vip1 [Cyberlindnera fabianii]CDR45842.1 CYFA0S20e00804g1_1 [Cyberlindnera fabianii]